MALIDLSHDFCDGMPGFFAMPIKAVGAAAMTVRAFAETVS